MADCIFDEDHFPTLGGDKNQKLKECQEISWTVKHLQYLDPRTSQTELEVQKITSLQYLASNLPDAFTDHKGVTKSHIPIVNTPQRVEVLKGSSGSIDVPQHQKLGRPISVKNKNLRKTKFNKETLSLLEPPEEDHPEDENPSTFARALNNHNAGIAEKPYQNILGNDEDLVDVNIEVAMNFVNTGETYNRNITIVDDIFSITFALTISIDNLDLEPKSIAECRKH